MLKKALAGLTALIVGASCYAPVSRPNISIDRLYTRETAKATLQDILSKEYVTIWSGTGGGCRHPSCRVDDSKFSCTMYCEASSAYPLAKGDQARTWKYSQIVDATCGTLEGNRAFLSTEENKSFFGGYIEDMIDFPDSIYCQKFIDALTYLKYY